MRTTLKTICAAGAAGLGIVYGAMTFTPASSWSLWLAGRVGFAQAAAFPSCVCRRRPRRSCGDCSLEALCARASQKAAKARRSSRVQQRSASPYGQFQASFWQWTPISGCKAAGLTMRRPRRVRPEPPQARPTRATALRKSTRRRMTAARRKAASQRMKTARTPGRQFRSSRGMPRTAAMRGTSEPWRDAATRM